MTKKINNAFLKIIAPFLVSITPAVAFAQSVQSGLGQIRSSYNGIGGRLFNSPDAITFIANLINILLFLAGAIAVLFVIIGGFQYLTSAGNAETAEKGKSTVVNAIIGIVIIILSYVIINAIVGTINRF
jgi:hypothetical protein